MADPLFASLVETENLGHVDLLDQGTAEVEVAVEEAEPNPLVRSQLVLMVVWRGEDVEEEAYRVLQCYHQHLEFHPMDDHQVAVDIAPQLVRNV